MMRPTFDDVIEYVKAGENNPELKEQLNLHPDGQELLKQARFICSVLREQYGVADGGGFSAVADVAAGGRDDADALELPSAREPRTLYQEAAYRKPRRRRPSAEGLVGYEGRRAEDLGTLEITEAGESVSIAYRASESVMLRYGKPLLKYMVAQADIEGIEIRARVFTLSLPDSLSAEEPMTIRVGAGVRQMPARGLEFTFMPESGPFLRLRVDDDGLLQIPVPTQPGTLRLEEPVPQVLRIKLKQ